MKKQLLLGALFLGSLFTANAQLSESFEGAALPAGWTVINNGDANTWSLIDLTGSTTLAAQDGNKIMGIQYSASAHNDYLVTPAISVQNGVSNILSFWGRSRDPLYPEVISVELSTTNATAGAFTTVLIPEVAPQSGASFFNFTYDLSAYEGQTVYIAFHSTTTDMFFFDLDLVEVLGTTPCVAPSGLTVVDPAPTTSTFNFGWTAVSGSPEGYEVEYGLADFTQGEGTTIMTTDTQVGLTDLASGTDYEFYIRTNCGDGNYSDWAGPYAFTSVFAPADLPYAYGFETDNRNGWTRLNAVTNGGAWGYYEGDEDFPAYEGTIFAATIGAAVASDSWLFSRPVNLVANDEVTLTFWLKKLILDTAGSGNVNNLTVTYGTDRTAAAQSNVVGTFNDFAELDYALQTVMFTPSASGVYYIGFHYTSPVHTNDSQGGLALDSVNITSVLGTEEVAVSNLSVYPNPVSNVINIANAAESPVNAVSVVDLNGRTVKTVKFDGVAEAQINVSDLASGVYLVTIETAKGNLTTKVVKN